MAPRALGVSLLRSPEVQVEVVDGSIDPAEISAELMSEVQGPRESREPISRTF